MHARRDRGESAAGTDQQVASGQHGDGYNR
jgi:hypothetical protein